MTSYTGNGATQAYAYDANGNRMSLSIGGASYANTIAADSNRLLGTTGPVPAKTNTYDLAGNLTNDATVTYTYTSRGRMSSATVGTAKTSYLYNGLGQRVRQVTGTAANPAGVLVYDEAGHIIGEYNSSTGKPSKEFVYLGDTPVGVLEQVATGTAPNQAHATNVYFIYTDHLDTPRVITRSPDGQMVWRWDSGDPFGLLPPNDNPAGFGVFTFNLRMPGQYYDKSTNLFYNYFRDYDPQTGRYVQSDPIGLQGGINTFGYVGANPVTNVDPFGLLWRCQGVVPFVSCVWIPPAAPFPADGNLPPRPAPINPWTETNTETRIPAFCPPDGPDCSQLLKSNMARCDRWFGGFIRSIPRAICYLAAQHAYKRCRAKTETSDGDPNGDGTTMYN